MSVIYFLIFCSAIISIIFLFAYLWASKNGQFEDNYTPSIRILLDNEKEDQIHNPPKENN